MNERANKLERILLILFAIAGMVIMGYLISIHYSPEEGSFCNLGEGLSCDIVNKSAYAKILGIPVSILGFLYFLGVLVFGIWRYTKPALKNIALLSIIFLGPSLYLTGIEFFVLNNICILCEISKILIVGIILVSLLTLRPEGFTKKSFVSAIILAILLGVFIYLIHAGLGQSEQGEKYNSFAQCLYERGVRMYGSATCSFCAKQRALFGDSFHYIQEIECDPRNPNPETERCIAKNILHTPTWILEDEMGNDIHRFNPGVVSFEKLSEISGCELPGDL